MPYRDPFYAATGPATCQHPNTNHVSGGPPNVNSKPNDGADVSSAFFHNAGSPRINTDIYMYNIIKAAHPDLQMLDTNPLNVNVIEYVAATGDGEVQPMPDPDEANTPKEERRVPSFCNQISYVPAARRLNGGSGAIAVNLLFDKFLVHWRGHGFLLYIVDHRDGGALYPQKRQYILYGEGSVDASFSLIRTVGEWQNVLHNEIWVFDQGFWGKDAGLWAAIQKSNWKDVILPDDLKEDLLDTVLRFYRSRETYERLHVPWKRGLIFYGPPGNGKTVSIKATMKTLYDQKEPVPTLYVKSLQSFAGPEYSISQIFAKARQQAPCYLVFEDLDSLVTAEVRAFFLNAVDGLSENEGILMVGSTNHLERLDPGIAKRPSRFDRKYLFSDPDQGLRRRYCQYWQSKLKENDDVEFPDELLSPIAELMEGFSFAYMQEAFVSTLLKIANESDKHDNSKTQSSKDIDAWDIVEMEEDLKAVAKLDGDDKDLDKYRLWREIKVQIANLRKELKKDA